MREITWKLADTIEGVVAEFTKQHPEVKVNVRTGTKPDTNKIQLTVESINKGRE